jgi:hypothetical protein
MHGAVSPLEVVNLAAGVVVTAFSFSDLPRLSICSPLAESGNEYNPPAYLVVRLDRPTWRHLRGVPANRLSPNLSRQFTASPRVRTGRRRPNAVRRRPHEEWVGPFRSSGADGIRRIDESGARASRAHCLTRGPLRREMHSRAPILQPVPAGQVVRFASLLTNALRLHMYSTGTIHPNSPRQVRLHAS